MKTNKIYCGDCLELMKDIPDESVDMILCDLPYNITGCEWDNILPFDKLWEHYNRIIKIDGAIVLTAFQPFTAKLIMSNLKMFKYEWIWNKVKPGNIFSANYKPMQNHENILVFGKSKLKYFPIMTDKHITSTTKVYGKSKTQNAPKYGNVRILKGKYPKSIITFSNANQRNRIHPTQKPVELFEYLIKTYTNEGDLVLDNCMGSGTTAVACKHLRRKFIGIELSQEYCNIANERLKQEVLDL